MASFSLRHGNNEKTIEQEKPVNFKALLHSIVDVFEELHGFDENRIILQYKDDEDDTVTISSDKELSGALECSGEALVLEVVECTGGVVYNADDDGDDEGAMQFGDELRQAMKQASAGDLSEKAQENVEQDDGDEDEVLVEHGNVADEEEEQQGSFLSALRSLLPGGKKQAADEAAEVPEQPVGGEAVDEAAEVPEQLAGGEAANEATEAEQPAGEEGQLPVEAGGEAVVSAEAADGDATDDSADDSADSLSSGGAESEEDPDVELSSDDDGLQDRDDSDAQDEGDPQVDDVVLKQAPQQPVIEEEGLEGEVVPSQAPQPVVEAVQEEDVKEGAIEGSDGAAVPEAADDVSDEVAPPQPVVEAVQEEDAKEGAIEGSDSAAVPEAADDTDDTDDDVSDEVAPPQPVVEAVQAEDAKEGGIEGSDGGAAPEAADDTDDTDDDVSAEVAPPEAVQEEDAKEGAVEGSDGAGAPEAADDADDTSDDDDDSDGDATSSSSSSTDDEGDDSASDDAHVVPPLAAASPAEDEYAVALAQQELLLAEALRHMELDPEGQVPVANPANDDDDGAPVNLPDEQAAVNPNGKENRAKSLVEEFMNLFDSFQTKAQSLATQERIMVPWDNVRVVFRRSVQHSVDRKFFPEVAMIDKGLEDKHDSQSPRHLAAANLQPLAQADAQFQFRRTQAGAAPVGAEVHMRAQALALGRMQQSAQEQQRQQQQEQRQRQQHQQHMEWERQQQQQQKQQEVQAQAQAQEQQEQAEAQHLMREQLAQEQLLMQRQAEQTRQQQQQELQMRQELEQAQEAANFAQLLRARRGASAPQELLAQWDNNGPETPPSGGDNDGDLHGQVEQGDPHDAVHGPPAVGGAGDADFSQNLRQLLDMGFPEDAARNALTTHGGELGGAIDALCR